MAVLRVGVQILLPPENAGGNLFLAIPEGSGNGMQANKAISYIFPTGGLNEKSKAVTTLLTLSSQTLAPLFRAVLDLYAQPQPPDANTAAYWGNLLGYMLQNPPMARDVGAEIAKIQPQNSSLTSPEYYAAIRAAVVLKV